MNFDSTAREDYATKATPQPAIIAAAHEYVEACDHLDRLQQQYRKINEELKRAETARNEQRERLLHLIAGTEEEPTNKSWR